MTEKKEYEGTLLALDMASGTTGYAIFQNGYIKASGIWKFRKIEGYNNFGDLTGKITAAIEKYDITQIVAEDIYKSRDEKLQNAHEVLLQCQAIAISTSQICEVPIYFISPITVKQHMINLTGTYRKLTDKERAERRKRQKAAMIREVQKLGYILNSDKDDEADAIGLLITYLETGGYHIEHPSQKRHPA
jgi:Holliday junction resolvasome RuvABC endonuclease subunit